MACRDAFREGQPPSLTIVIPALNEEQAIAAIIERSLAARGEIRAQTGIERIDVVVVSDGSTDRTPEIAARYPEIDLIVFPKNRGYGAAIQQGWASHPNELLGFLDADGTCDPRFFAPLCQAILVDGAEIALGSRLGPDSQMPATRRIGNALFAWFLRLLSRRQARDTASGMRVLRKSVLPELMPLPDGLHFTPAMSARALLEGLRIAELPMSYSERVGRSKLSVVKDGVRFLRVIVETALFVRPSRLLLPFAGLLVLVSAALLTAPAVDYLRFHHVDDWLIYRFLFSGLLVNAATLVWMATYLMEQLIAVSRGGYALQSVERVQWWTRVDGRAVAALGAAAGILSVCLVWQGIHSYVLTQHVSLHWSRVVSALFAALFALQMVVTLLLDHVVHGVARQQAALHPAATAGPAGESAGGAPQR